MNKYSGNQMSYLEDRAKPPFVQLAAAPGLLKLILSCLRSNLQLKMYHVML